MNCNENGGYSGYTLLAVLLYKELPMDVALTAIDIVSEYHSLGY